MIQIINCGAQNDHKVHYMGPHTLVNFFDALEHKIKNKGTNSALNN